MAKTEKTMIPASEVARRLHVQPRTIRKWAPRWPGAELRREERGPVWYIPEDMIDWWYTQRHIPGPRPCDS